jgi:ABC-type multidrug transport system fused ATPase/permease subunit
MNDLINLAFGDPLIYLDCNQAGECLHESQLPDWKPPSNPPFSTFSIVIMSLSAILMVVSAFWGLSWLKKRDGRFRDDDRRHLLMDEEDVREQEQHLMANHTPSTLCFTNISYSIPQHSHSLNFPLSSTPQNMSDPNVQTVLKDIKGFVCPGELLAIMGGSGAGKTTFLDILARKNKRGTISGEIIVNGKMMDIQEYKSIIGYVFFVSHIKVC